MSKQVIVLLSALWLGCTILPPPSPLPGPAGSVAVEPTTPDSCQTAGAHLRAMGCPTAATPAGVPFAVACVDAVNDGRPWNAGCIARAPTCADVETAYQALEGTCPW